MIKIIAHSWEGLVQVLHWVFNQMRGTCRKQSGTKFSPCAQLPRLRISLPLQLFYSYQKLLAISESIVVMYWLVYGLLCFTPSVWYGVPEQWLFLGPHLLYLISPRHDILELPNRVRDMSLYKHKTSLHVICTLCTIFRHYNVLSSEALVPKLPPKCKRCI